MSQNGLPISERKAWLSDYEWDLVESLNQGLCQNGGYLHKPTSDGYTFTKNLWESNHKNEMSFIESLEFLYSCHKNAPFCFLNGNTFVTIARRVTETIKLSSVNSHIIRSISGHIVAGTVKKEERERLVKILNSESLGEKLKKIERSAIRVISSQKRQDKIR